MKDALNRMGKLSDMMLDAALAELRQIRQEQAGHQAAIAELRQKKNDVQSAVTTSPDLVRDMLRAEAWNKWTQREIVNHNNALARLHVVAEETEAKAHLQFGRQQAARALRDVHVQRQKMARQRKAYES